MTSTGEIEQLALQLKSSLVFGDLPIHESIRKHLYELMLDQHTVVIHGKHIKTPRLVGFFSDESKGYSYTGNTIMAQPLDPVLTDLLKEVNELTKSDFNAILMNRYRDGNDYIGAHSDNENSLGRCGVYAVSLGCDRVMRFKHKRSDKSQDVVLKDGMSVLMGGEFQRHFTHELLKDKKIKEERISLTFRKHIK